MQSMTGTAPALNVQQPNQRYRYACIVSTVRNLIVCKRYFASSDTASADWKCAMQSSLAECSRVSALIRKACNNGDISINKEEHLHVGNIN